MKKFSLFLALLILVSVTACKKKGEETETAPPSETKEEGLTISLPDYPDVELSEEWEQNDITVERTVYAKTFSEGETGSLTVSGAFPKTGTAAIDAYYESVLEDFKRLSEALAEEAYSIGASCRLEAEFADEINAGGIFSVSRTIFQNMGGADGGTGVICETFSVSTGTRLTLDDFFTVDRDVYTGRVLEYVDALIDENPDGFWADAKQIARGLFPYDNFCITSNGISLFFHEYNIAAGVVRINIPWGGIAEWFELPG
jgi:predicted small lipoprotein YifL